MGHPHRRQALSLATRRPFWRLAMGASPQLEERRWAWRVGIGENARRRFNGNGRKTPITIGFLRVRGKARLFRPVLDKVPEAQPEGGKGEKITAGA